MHKIESELQQIHVGQQSRNRNLSVFPLFAESVVHPNYLILSQVVDAGEVSIREVSTGGTVPQVLLENRADKPVLVLEGEQLIGCKQNRVVNLTILAPAKATLEIPVSCVEQGRWSYDSDAFVPSHDFTYPSLRVRKSEQVSAAMAQHLGPASDQGAIWANLARKTSRMGSDSRSSAMAGIYSRRKADLHGYDGAGRWSPHQRGAVFAINGRCVGLELFDASSSCEHYLGRIASGYALDALDHYTPVFEEATSEAVRVFLARIEAASVTGFPAIGLGEDLRLTAPGLSGAALAAEGSLVHLCAFDLPAEDAGGHEASPSAAESSIRRRRLGAAGR